jgi:hypothetical protein
VRFPCAYCPTIKANATAEEEEESWPGTTNPDECSGSFVYLWHAAGVSTEAANLEHGVVPDDLPTRTSSGWGRRRRQDRAMGKKPRWGGGPVSVNSVV